MSIQLPKASWLSAATAGAVVPLGTLFSQILPRAVGIPFFLLVIAFGVVMVCGRQYLGQDMKRAADALPAVVARGIVAIHIRVLTLTLLYWAAQLYKL